MSEPRDTPRSDDIDAVARAMFRLHREHWPAAELAEALEYRAVEEFGDEAQAAIQTLIERGWKKPG